MPKKVEYVVNGAHVKCSQGTMETTLKATSNSRIGNQLRIVETDTTPASFNGDFKICKRQKGKPCSMNNLPKWFNTNAVFVSGSGIPCVTKDSFLVCTTGAGAITLVDSGQNLEELEYYAVFAENLIKQFGFDERTAQLIINVKIKIDQLNSGKTQMERDYIFTRAISGFVYSYGDSKKEQWATGAGYIWPYANDKNFIEAKKYFTNTLGFNEDDFNYLKYNLRLQNQISGGSGNYNPNMLYALVDKGLWLWKSQTHSDTYKNFKSAMETGLGRKLSDSEFEKIYSENYNSFKGNGDFSHFMYTVAGNIADTSQQGLKDKFNPTLWLNFWSNHDARKEYIGWLGDATYAGKFGNDPPTFGIDDYIADLDAANIVNRMEDGSSFTDAYNSYYRDYNIDSSIRESEFTQIYSYDYVEKKVLDAAGVDSVEKLKDKWPDSYDFLDKIKP